METEKKDLELTKDERFISSIKNSLLYVFFSLFIQLPISLVLALIVAKNLATAMERVYNMEKTDIIF